MGKAKKRLAARAKNEKNQLQISRDKALSLAAEELGINPTSPTAKNLISLFGLSAEELAEVGVTYEVLRAMDGLLN